MHVLAFVNQKGGCGKTTTAVHLAGALVARGEQALLVDLDPQAHATLALGCAIEGEPTLIDVLMDRVTLREAIYAAPGGIGLVPASSALAEYEELAERRLGAEHALARVLACLRARPGFVLLDCPPRADGVLTSNALRAADTVLLVVETGAFALQGALRAIHLLAETATSLERPFVLRAVGTLFDRRTRIAREILVGMQAQLGIELFDTVIRASAHLREAPARGLPVQILAPHSRACADFAALADEVVAHARAFAAGRREEHAAPAVSTRPSGPRPLLMRAASSAGWPSAPRPEPDSTRNH